MCMPAAWREFLEFEACSSLAYVFFKSESQSSVRSKLDKKHFSDIQQGPTSIDSPTVWHGLNPVVNTCGKGLGLMLKPLCHGKNQAIIKLARGKKV